MPDELDYSFAALRNRLTARGELAALSGLRIGAGRDSGVVGNDLPVLRDALGRPFIPGASLKGAFRARVEALVHSAAPDQARDLEAIERRMRDGMVADKQDAEIWRESTMIELTFGAPWIAGRIFFKDAPVRADLWFGQFEVRNGVALNRDTETVEQGLLYDYEVVPAGTRFEMELTLENAADWQLGMVLLALQPWERGEMQIGGFRSRGLGHVRLEGVTYRFSALRPGNADDVLAFLDGGGQAPTAEQITAWKEAFREELRRRAGAQSRG
ncbi:MAG: CRISPR-associated RAMP protein [Chloroflexi bacterium]|nr:CRISPR-associated RAMP protein [Chloroflexota bacterium]